VIAAAQFSARGSNAPLSCTFESFQQENNRDFERSGKQIKPKPDHMHDSFGPAFNLWLANHESCAKTKA
jgi:hypothetical protein